MKSKKELVFLYTRINGVERVQVSPELDSRLRGNDRKQGMEINREFHEALGLKAGGVR